MLRPEVYQRCDPLVLSEFLCVYIMKLKTKRCMRGSMIIWWSICGHVMACRSVVAFDMHIVLVPLVDVNNLTFEF